MNARTILKIGLIGERNENNRSHIATEGALEHAAKTLGVEIKIEWISTEALAQQCKNIETSDIIWAAPGAHANRDGMLEGIRYARENNVPFIGTCGGFQNTLLEYARNILGFSDAEHEETALESSSLFVTRLACSLVGTRQEVNIKPETIAYRTYKKSLVFEQFNCNFGLNPKFRADIEQSKFVISGTDRNGEVRMLELSGHNFFVATLFLPQLSSEGNNPHPLILRLLSAGVDFKRSRES